MAPAVWRRAVTLTRRRIEASIPLTQTEIQADKDRIRAEYAMANRRLEMNVKALREKAAEQLVEISRGHEALKGLAIERTDKNHALAELSAKNEALRQREEELHRLSERLKDTERKLEKRALELEKLEQMYDDASFSSSSRQIELVARESELQKLASDIALLRGQRKEADRRQQEIAAESKAARDALKAEKKRVAELDKKVERLLATLADREDKLDRREKELARLREKAKAEDGGPALRLVGKPDAAGGHDEAKQRDDLDQAIAKLDSDRERLEARLTALARENKRLKADLGAMASSGTANGSAALREQMNELAAEVVHLTAKLEGPDSPIAKALAAPQDSRSNSGDRSLADRVRALQKADAN
ncbi:mll2809 [Mesorhizobium japonicum MAFF 303099]|uniref:Mll2809 protein n=1 Tax=Mesorhizobium japonicum (strain LMG 29417 / CECT 9101 / MAFF 303099) TaxID=266835 RepID=Q98HM0_RHILO|nr:mll2809 [Mesorhizobium japonicum MAFF 303099]